MAGKYTTAFTMLMNFFMIKRYLILFLSQLIKIKFINEILIKDLTRILKCRVLISKMFSSYNINSFKSKIFHSLFTSYNRVII